MPVVEGIVVGLATSALLRMGRQVETAARQRLDRGGAEELRASTLLCDMQFDKSLLRGTVDLPAGLTFAEVDVLLQAPRAQAIAFELLVAQLSGALDASAPRLRAEWNTLFAEAFPSGHAASAALFEVLVTHYQIALDVLSRECPNAYARLQGDSHHQRLVCVLESIERRLDPTTKPPVDLGKLAADLGVYRRQLREAHKNITPPDFDRRRDVPIEQLYVSPTITYEGGMKEDGVTGVSLRAEVDRTVLLGDPGNGKSTASQVLVHEISHAPNEVVPFLVILRDFAGAKLERSVIEYLVERLRNFYQAPLSKTFIEHLFETGEALVVFDGLDELLDTSHRREVTDAVRLFCNRYPLTRVLVTSRRVGYHQAPMDPGQFRVLELSGFDREQVRAYVEKWFAQQDLDGDAIASWTDSFMDESASVQDLTRTPLLLALMCIIYRGEKSLPRNRPAVYERCATMLFEKWDSSRNINADLQVGQLLDPAMKHLAYWLFSGDSGDGVTESALVSEATTYLHERSFEDERDAEVAAKEFVEFCRGRAWVFTDVGTTPQGESLYKFTHRTFLEYFAAYHLSRQSDSPEKLARRIVSKVAHAEWDVVAQLAVQITDKHHDRGAIRIFEVLLNERRRRNLVGRSNVLAFLGRCLTFVHVSPGVLRQLTRETFSITMEAASARVFDFLELSPLGTVLGNSHFFAEEVVEDELASCLESSIVGDDVTLRETALSFITVAPWLLLGNGDTRADAYSQRQKWETWFQDCSARYKDAYLSYLGSDLELSVAALRRGWVDVKQVLEAFDEGLDPIFSSAPCRTFGITFVDYSFTLLAMLERPSDGATDEGIEMALRGLRQVADYAEARHEAGLPLCSAYAAPFVDSDRQPLRELRHDLVIDDRALLGAALLLARQAEVAPGHFLRKRDWGVMAPALDVIRYRVGLDHPTHRSTEELPRDKFQLLYQWASGAYSFSTQAEREQDAGQE